MIYFVLLLQAHSFDWKDVAPAKPTTFPLLARDTRNLNENPRLFGSLARHYQLVELEYGWYPRILLHDNSKIVNIDFSAWYKTASFLNH